MGTFSFPNNFLLCKMSLDHKITIPKKYRKYLKTVPGQSFKVYYGNGALLLIPVINTYKKDFKKFVQEVEKDLGHKVVVDLI